jgi:hypothetical protein
MDKAQFLSHIDNMGFGHGGMTGENGCLCFYFSSRAKAQNFMCFIDFLRAHGIIRKEDKDSIRINPLHKDTGPESELFEVTLPDNIDQNAFTRLCEQMERNCEALVHLTGHLQDRFPNAHGILSRAGELAILTFEAAHSAYLKDFLKKILRNPSQLMMYTKSEYITAHIPLDEVDVESLQREISRQPHHHRSILPLSHYRM